MRAYYKGINITLILITIFLMSGLIKYLEQLIWKGTAAAIFVLAISAVMVHGLKGLRLYFALYEKQLPAGLFIRQYCKVTPAVMILPFKTGDLFRAYCFGYHLRDYMAGVAVIMFDRFVDTVALITVMLAISLYLSVSFDSVFFFLFFALCVLGIVYFVCPGMCAYWKRYFMMQKATKGKLRLIRFISNVQREYLELQAVVNGKFLIAYLLSLLAWMVEIGGLYILSSLIFKADRALIIKKYLDSGLTGTGSEYLGSFIGFSVLLLLFVYFFVSVTYWLRKAGSHE